MRGSWTASKTKYYENLKQNSQWTRLCSLVESLKVLKLLPEKLLLTRLTARLENETVLGYLGDCWAMTTFPCLCFTL